MSQQRWYVCADGEGATWLASAVSQVHGTRDVRVGSDPWELRKALLAELPGSSSVAILTGCQGMEPINLAAALVRDAHAREVVLVCDGATGSLRSRARRAGVTRVVEASELASAVRVGAKGQEHGKAPARKASAWTAGGESDQMGDLDEPDCLGMTAPSRPVTGMPQAPVLVFASGRGGVGKTTLVAVAAHVAESWGMRVAIVDFDLAFGNLFGFLGLDGPADLAPLGAVREDLPSAIVRCGRKVDDSVALWGPCVRPELAETVQPHAGSILRTLSSRYDLVLVDTSTTWGDAIAQGVQCCDRLLLVADERAGAVA